MGMHGMVWRRKRSPLFVVIAALACVPLGLRLVVGEGQALHAVEVRAKETSPERSPKIEETSFERDES